jgi:hypothetical protein
MNFLEKNELDRIKASKAAFLNYSATLSSIISAVQLMSERLLIYHEALKPEHDIQFIIERYRTGPFIPRVILYNNHYCGSAIGKYILFEGDKLLIIHIFFGE